MYRHFFFKLLVMSGLMFLWMSGICLADVASQLEQAEMYRRWFPERAEETCKTITASYPGTDYALEAYKTQILLYMSTGKYTEANDALDKIFTGFAGNEKSAKTLWDVAARCEIFARHDRAGEDAAAANYDMASRIYQRIIQNHPGSPYGGRAQIAVSRVMTLQLITAGQYTAAETAAAGLRVNFAGHSDLPMTLYNIARRYGKSQNYEQAKNIYKEIIKNYPDTTNSKHALSSQKQLVYLAMSAGNDTGAQQALDKLITDFSGHNRLLPAIYDIAWTYEQSGRYDRATSIYQQIVQKHPDINRSGQMSPNDYRADKAGLDIDKCQILALINSEEPNKPDTVSSAIDKLISDYQGHPYLPALITRIARQYYKKAGQAGGNSVESTWYFQKGAVLLEKVTKELPDSTTAAQLTGRMGEYETATPKAYCLAGDCYRQLKQYEKSNQCYQKIIDDYPQFRMVWKALFLLGRNYEKMLETGLISKSQAQSKIEAVYQQLVETYPDLKLTRHAASWLAGHSSN